MPITTIDSNNRYLQLYGDLTVSPDLAAELARQQADGAMMGMDPFNGVPIPGPGDSLLDFVAQLHFAGQPQLASDIASMNGIRQQDFTGLMQQINDATTSNPHGVLGAISGIGNTVAENPALLFAAPLAIAGLGGLFGAGGGVGAGGAGAGSGGAFGTLGGTTGATFDALGNVLVTGAAPTLGASGLAAGIGGAAAAAGAASGGVAPASEVPNGYSGSSTMPGAPTMTVYPPVAPAMDLGAGALTGIGLGGAAGAAALLGGGGSAAVPQGPPEPPQGPPDSGGGGAAAGAGAAAGGLAGLGLPGWLTLAGLAGSALQGTPDITQRNANEPPAYLAPYLQQAAGAAQAQYGQGNYVAPVQQSAIDYTTNVLTGNYLNSNPWLDQTFNKAAGAVTNQVQSNFGRSGRDVRGPDAAGLATDKYSNLAAQIYGGNYQAERDRMQQLVPQASQLGSATDPSRSLDDYIARLRNIGGGYGTATQTTPTQNNWWSGLAGLGLALMPGG